MPDLLLIGGATNEMTRRMEDAFTVHRWSEKDAGWLAEHGASITHVATNGHDGVPAEVMAALPNLAMISCYGVGYDAIDVGEAVRRGIMVTHTPDVLNAEVATTARARRTRGAPRASRPRAADARLLPRTAA